MNVGERIKQKRLELNMSQDELAKKVGYKSRSSINKIETMRDLPLKKVTKMARALGCSESYLMGWEEPSNDSKIMMIGGNARYLPVFAESDDIEKALELYKAYSDASHDVQSAIEILLKSHLSDS